MSTVIRLTRGGRKKAPFYHVVVADKRTPRDGRFIEKLGWYNPLAEGKGKWEMANDRLSHWLECGAQPSDRVITMLLAEGLGSERQRTQWEAKFKRRGDRIKKLVAEKRAKAEAEKAAADAEAAAEAKAAAAAEVEAAPAAEAEAPAEAAADAPADAE